MSRANTKLLKGKGNVKEIQIHYFLIHRVRLGGIKKENVNEYESYIQFVNGMV